MIADNRTNKRPILKLPPKVESPPAPEYRANFEPFLEERYLCVVLYREGRVTMVHRTLERAREAARRLVEKRGVRSVWIVRAVERARPIELVNAEKGTP